MKKHPPAMWIIREHKPDLAFPTVVLPVLILVVSVVFHVWQVHKRHAREDLNLAASEKILKEAADPRSSGMFEHKCR